MDSPSYFSHLKSLCCLNYLPVKSQNQTHIQIINPHRSFISTHQRFTATRQVQGHQVPQTIDRICTLPYFGSYVCDAGSMERYYLSLCIHLGSIVHALGLTRL